MERPVTVGVITVAYGEKYRGFLPEWAAAVAALDRKPDKITVVTDTVEGLTEARAILPTMRAISSTTPFQHHPQILANEAIAVTRTDWICKLDADDLIFPHALTPLDDWQADVCMFGISVNGERNLIPPPLTAGQVLASPHNLMFAGSPFRRAIWERTPGFQDMIYDDWAFWRACARAGATFHPTGTIDYLYRLHDGNASTGVDHATEARRVFGNVH